MAVYSSNIVNDNLAMCWNIPLLANRTRKSMFKNLFIFCKNRFSEGKISRKGLYLNNIEILRDFTPECQRYLAGLVDGDGYIERYVLSITLHSDEKDLLDPIQRLLGGGKIHKVNDKNSYRYKVYKNRVILINNIAPYLSTKKKIAALQEWYNYTPGSTNTELSV